MECYNHPQKKAAAVCMACGKAICRDCARESSGAIACQQECAEKLAVIADLRLRQKKHLQNIKRLNFIGSLFSVIMGIFFMYFSTLGYGVVYDFILILGGGFTVYGIVTQLVIMVQFIRSEK